MKIGLKSGCSSVSVEPYVFKLNATLWTPKHGDPRKMAEPSTEPYLDVFQPGIYSFVSKTTFDMYALDNNIPCHQPFSFEPLPDNVQILQDEKKATMGRVRFQVA